MEGMELICFNIISSVGMAKSSYEAMRAAAAGNFDEATAKIKGHNAHSDLIEQESNGTPVVPSLLLLHAEDQMMSSETIRLMAEENIKLYKRLSEMAN